MMSERRPRFPAQVLRPAAPSGTGGAVPRNSSTSLSVGNQPVARKPAAVSPPHAASAGSSSQAAARMRMAGQLAAAGIRSAAVLEAMRQVERHAFIDSALASKAYEDNSLPIGFGQTISKPSVVARMLSLLVPEDAPAGFRLPGRVLEIGTGCGYQAALLSRIATEVYSIERVKGLHERARDNLRALRVANLHLLFGDGMLGYAKGGPYTAIISAAGGDAIPAAWVEQLAVGGRIIAPTQSDKGHQLLMVVDKTNSGTKQFALEAVHFVPLKSGVT